MGIIAATTNMPSSKFVFPKNTDTSIQPNTAFTIQMAIKNIQTGTFVNAQANYYSAPQQVNAQGQIIGHTHVVIEKLTSLDQTTPTDPNVFAFFKGINGAAQNGIVTADVTAGLPAGTYKISSINAAANHQPVLVAVAQHGSLDDVAYVSVYFLPRYRFVVTDICSSAVHHWCCSSWRQSCCCYWRRGQLDSCRCYREGCCGHRERCYCRCRCREGRKRQRKQGCCWQHQGQEEPPSCTRCVLDARAIGSTR